MGFRNSINIESKNTKEDPDRSEGFVKLYARGKIGLLFSGDRQYAKVAEGYFRQALEITVNLNAHSFASEMRKCGASEKAIYKFLDNCTLVDEAHLSPILD